MAIDIKRHEAICRLFKQGVTGPRIAFRFGISRERVRQILNRHGIKASQGGVQKEAQINQLNRKERWLNKIMPFWGVTKKQWLDIRKNPEHKNYIAAYKTQKNHATRIRGIDFAMNYFEWKKIWDDSGKWDNRGRGVGEYCMSRYGDIGPYAVDNVDIILSSKNHTDFLNRYWANKRLALSE